MELTIKCLLLAFFSGFVCKLYDDLKDNKTLLRFKTDILMEMLKGLHYIGFTIVSLEEPLFYCFQVIGNIFHRVNNKSGYNEPYEKSVFFSFLLLLFVLDFNKIQKLTFNDFMCVIVFVTTLLSEPLIFKTEYSIVKFIYRFFVVIFSSAFTLYFIKGISNSVLCLLFYYLGYLLLSVFIQYYSVFIYKEEIKKQKKNKNKKRIKTKKE